MLTSLALGILAALCWGVHDLLVRIFVRADQVFTSLLTVLLFGSLLQLPVSLFAMQSHMPPPTAIGLSAISGILYAVAGFALYKAFIIGPVRTVAPIIGAYPLVSVTLAAFAGNPLNGDQLVAIAVVIIAAGYVSAGGEKDTSSGQKKVAIAWAILSAVGFASSFSFGQSASEIGDELSLLAPNRLFSLLALIVIALVAGAPVALAKTQRQWWLLMALLDTVAHSAVISAGKLEHPSLASVGASIFGLITIALAALILKEKLTGSQWIAVIVVFVSIGYLGF